ncbi:MAG: hypothetical protein BWY67_02244 [Bacteroidetes bacterium ADurb.Bin397]|nr:MAG: hypothetical protein BWY67_02244 [Bacteroidetes bacterium ADurb.Bin397]
MAVAKAKSAAAIAKHAPHGPVETPNPPTITGIAASPTLIPAVTSEAIKIASLNANSGSDVLSDCVSPSIAPTALPELL